MPRHPKILFITRHTPLPWDDGSGAYVFSLLDFLRKQGFEIHVAWLAPHSHLCWQGVWALPRDYARAIRLRTPSSVRLGRRLVFPDIYWLPFKAGLLGRIKRTLRFLRLVSRQGKPTASAGTAAAPRPWTDTPNAEETRYATSAVEKIRPDVIIANYPWLIPLLPAKSSAHRVCLHHDIAWKRALQQSSLSGRPPEISAATEAGWLQKVDTVIEISSEDYEETGRLCPNLDRVLARKAVTLSPLPPVRSQRLLFVGSGNSFNVEGLSWFFETVWPSVRREFPEACLDVCGNIDGAIDARPANVAFHGQVPDVLKFYQKAAVVIVPLLHATGLNIKLVDAAACGRPIVTTPITIQGAPFLREAVAVADTPENYAKEVVRLLRHTGEGENQAQRALDVVRAQLAPEVAYADLLRKFRAVTASLA